ncbi:MAG: nucleoside deaminase, partial [Paraprevotella sp.]|nr:nucleoside deaminase [Paraprevotella sp.]
MGLPSKHFGKKITELFDISQEVSPLCSFSVFLHPPGSVGRGHNCVLSLNDPTCHGEVAAIRDAGKKLGTFDLSGCELYTTGEPCHMC